MTESVIDQVSSLKLQVSRSYHSIHDLKCKSSEVVPSQVPQIK